MDKRRFTPLHLILAVLLTFLGTVGALGLAGWLIMGPTGLAMVEGFALVNTRFVGEYDQDTVTDSVMTELVDSLGDRWSYYLTPDRYEVQQEKRANSYVGIGVTVSYEREEGLLIMSVTEDGPAGQVGVLAGEVITAVDGTSIAGEAKENGTSLILGEAGTTVELTLLAEDGSTRTVTVTRIKLSSSSVSYEMVEDGIGLIKVKNFYTDSARQMQAAVEELRAQGAAALIFDMRNNSGGYVTELTEILDDLLPEGPIFRSTTKSGRETVVQSDEACVELPMAVLVNENTYSAAEFFAAELQEQGWAAIVGSETSGKGYSQVTFALPTGGALALSTGVYRTGEGVSLIGTGLSLDYPVDLTEENAKLLASGILKINDDLQMQTALEVLRGQ